MRIFLYLRNRHAKVFPSSENLIYTAACLFRPSYSHKETLKNRIAANAPSSSESNLLIAQSIKIKLFIFIKNTKHNDSTVSIGKSRIAFPETTGKSTFRRLELNLRRLIKIKEGLYLVLKDMVIVFHTFSSQI